MLPNSAQTLARARARRRSRRAARRERPRPSIAWTAPPAQTARPTRRSMFVTRLPKRSTRSTSPRTLPARPRGGRGTSRRWTSATGRPSADELDALRQPRRGRREPIAPFERPADGRPRVAALGQLDDLLRRAPRRSDGGRARRCRARRTGSRPPRPQCRAAPSRRRDRRRRGRSCPAGK